MSACSNPSYEKVHEAMLRIRDAILENAPERLEFYIKTQYADQIREAINLPYHVDGLTPLHFAALRTDNVERGIYDNHTMVEHLLALCPDTIDVNARDSKTNEPVAFHLIRKSREHFETHLSGAERGEWGNYYRNYVPQVFELIINHPKFDPTVTGKTKDEHIYTVAQRNEQFEMERLLEKVSEKHLWNKVGAIPSSFVTPEEKGKEKEKGPVTGCTVASSPPPIICLSSPVFNSCIPLSPPSPRHQEKGERYKSVVGESSRSPSPQISSKEEEKPKHVSPAPPSIKPLPPCIPIDLPQPQQQQQRQVPAPVQAPAPAPAPAPAVVNNDNNNKKEEGNKKKRSIADMVEQVIEGLSAAASEGNERKRLCAVFVFEI